VVAGAPARLPIFEPDLHGPQRDARERRGYIGLPKAEWFGGELGASGGARAGDGTRAGNGTHAGDGTHAGQGPVFRPLDFVWSLSKAKAKKTAAQLAPRLGLGEVDGAAQSFAVVGF